MRYREKYSKPEYRGLFRLRQFLMTKMPHIYAKVFYRSFLKSKAAFLDALTGRSSKYENDYLFARYVNSWIEKEDDRRKVLKALAEWLHRENLVKLLDTLVNVIIFDNNIIIVTSRPNMWIGKGCSTVDSLQLYMQDKFSPDTKILFKEISSPVPELRRLIDDIENLWGDFINVCGSSFMEFEDLIDEYVKDEKKKEPLYTSINRNTEYETLDILKHIK